MTGTVADPSAAHQPGPIEAAGATLASWLGAVAGRTTYAPPSDDESSVAELTIWPLELVPDHRVSGTDRPQRIKVRHLVTARGPSAAALRLLDRVLVAAEADSGAPDVTVGPVAPEVWLALGARPRLALLFDVPVRVPPAAETARPLVRGPLVLQEGALQVLSGRVLGPSDVPVPGVRLEVAGTGASTWSGSGGAFVLPGVPARTPLRLQMSGRGVHRTVDLPADGAPDDVVVRFELEES